MFQTNDTPFVVKGTELVLYGADPPGCVYEKYAKGRSVCGIVTALGGKTEYLFSDGRRRELAAGEIALFSEKTAYIVRNVSDEPFAHYTVNFSLCMGEMLPEDEFYCNPSGFYAFSRLCAELLDVWRTQGASARLRCTGYVYEMLSILFEERMLNKVGRTAYANIEPALRFMDAHYGENIGIEGLAALCMMSKTGFRRTFTEVCGVSPIEYLLRTRMKRAAEYLCQTTQNVAEIASACGFKDTEHFCRTFKKRMGVTAGEARKRM